MRLPSHACLILTLLLPLAPCLALAEQEAPAMPATEVPDSRFLEKELQSLNWPQFRFVVHAVPRLRAEVDAYGPLGWQYVERHYRSYGWSRSINKLDASQRRELAALIARARTGAH